jgi:hypothetical protein
MNPFKPHQKIQMGVRFRIWATNEQRIVYFYDCRSRNGSSFLQHSSIRHNPRMEENLIFEI